MIRENQHWICLLFVFSSFFKGHRVTAVYPFKRVNLFQVFKQVTALCGFQLSEVSRKKWTACLITAAVLRMISKKHLWHVVWILLKFWDSDNSVTMLPLSVAFFSSPGAPHSHRYPYTPIPLSITFITSPCQLNLLAPQELLTSTDTPLLRYSDTRIPPIPPIPTIPPIPPITPLPCYPPITSKQQFPSTVVAR